LFVHKAISWKRNATCSIQMKTVMDRSIVPHFNISFIVS